MIGRIVRLWELGVSGMNGAGCLSRHIALPDYLGNSSQTRPSSTLPAFFLLAPLNCLKKNDTLAETHWSRI